MTAVIFDMDGVIFDSERLYIDCCTEVAAKLGMERIVETCHKCIGVTTDITRKILLETYGDEKLIDIFQKQTVTLFREKYSNGMLKMKDGVRELLEYLRRKGVKVAIASSTRTDIVEKELYEAGIRHYFKRIIGGDQVSRSKPNPDIFLRAADVLGKQPEQCIVIEDSYNGIRAAKAAGMTAIMVPDLLPPTEEMMKLADVIQPSLIHVLNYMQGNENTRRKGEKE